MKLSSVWVTFSARTKLFSVRQCEHFLRNGPDFFLSPDQNLKDQPHKNIEHVGAMYTVVIVISQIHYYETSKGFWGSSNSSRPNVKIHTFVGKSTNGGWQCAYINIEYWCPFLMRSCSMATSMAIAIATTRSGVPRKREKTFFSFKWLKWSGSTTIFSSTTLRFRLPSKIGI